MQRGYLNSYYIIDHLGSIRQTVGANGIMSAQDYYPFGGIMRSFESGGLQEKYKFTGKERDKESGLDYFGARYYDSGIGRWLSVDPLGSQRPGLSPYQYCQNNPLALIDPTGMLDDWFENEDHEVVYDKDIHSQEDLDKKGIKGTYEGTEGYAFDSETGEVVHYNTDGTITREVLTMNGIDIFANRDDSHSDLSKANMIVSAASTEKNIINGIVKELPEAQASKYFRFSETVNIFV